LLASLLVVDAGKERGRAASEPQEIPARGWWDITWRAIRRFARERMSVLAAGLAMYGLLSVFPALAAMVSIYGLFDIQADAIRQMHHFANLLPPGVWDVLNAQLHEISRRPHSALGTTAALGLLIALWSGRAAMSSLITATSVAYGEPAKRGLFTQLLLSLLLTVGALLGFLAVLLLGVAIPVALKALGVSGWVHWVATLLRLALLGCVAMLGLAVVYRYAPLRERAQWRWVTWGSSIASLLWLLASALFAEYVRTFGSYGRTYGALSSVMVLLLWFYLSSIVVVLGATINAEMERQTCKDTTVRGGAPLGQRGAYVADTVGRAVDNADHAEQLRPVDARARPARRQAGHPLPRTR
jgi:membrane protein